MRAGGFVDRKRQVGEDFAEKEPGAGIAVDQVRVFADPAEPGVAGERFFQDRCAVDEGAVLRSGAAFGDPVRQPREALAQHLVIVAPQRIARDVAELRVGQHVVGRCGLRRQVIHSCRDHADGAGHEFLRSRAFATVPGHVFHLAVPAQFEPAHQIRFVGFDADGGNADLLEAEFVAPAPDVVGEVGG